MDQEIGIIKCAIIDISSRPFVVVAICVRSCSEAKLLVDSPGTPEARLSLVFHLLERVCLLEVHVSHLLCQFVQGVFWLFFHC